MILIDEAVLNVSIVRRIKIEDVFVSIAFRSGDIDRAASRRTLKIVLRAS